MLTVRLVGKPGEIQEKLQNLMELHGENAKALDVWYANYMETVRLEESIAETQSDQELAYLTSLGIA